MSNFPLKVVKRDAATTPSRKAEPRDVELVTPGPRSTGFLSFRYSHTEISSHGGRTRVTAKEVRLEDGKLSTERFEGELDGSAYDTAVRQAQQQVLGQAAWLMHSLSAWLPWRGTPGGRK
jgi:hypothetical protein